jgi:hypothetical protein
MGGNDGKDDDKDDKERIVSFLVDRLAARKGALVCRHSDSTHTLFVSFSLSATFFFEFKIPHYNTLKKQ